MIVTLLTDFGLADHYVGTMKGALLSVCPQTQLVDISHEVAPYQILQAAYTLSQAWQTFPAGTIHVTVIDPGVGSSRRPILVEAGGHYFIAPDNGVLTMVLNAQPGYSARHITAREYFRPTVSQTFHGRDIFAPVAGHLASGVPPANFGEAIDNPVIIPIAGVVLSIDRFGNVITSFRWDDPGPRFELILGDTVIQRQCRSYSEAQPGELFAIKGSGGFVEVSLNQGNAARALGVSPGTTVEIRRV
jgi:S-adenosylmethionine hydrolase